MGPGTPRELTQHRAWLSGCSVNACYMVFQWDGSPVLGKLLASPQRNQYFPSLHHWSGEQMESPPTAGGRQGCRSEVVGEVSVVTSRSCFLIAVGMFSSYYSPSPSRLSLHLDFF